MGVSFIPCPSCQTMLLEDTVQCPECAHVLDESRAALLDIAARASSANGPADDEVACPACGEFIRAESVRCWKCGTFLREEMARAFQRMQAGERISGAGQAAGAAQVGSTVPATLDSLDVLPVRESDDVVVPADEDDFVMGAAFDDVAEDAGYVPSFAEPELRAEDPPATRRPAAAPLPVPSAPGTSGVPAAAPVPTTAPAARAAQAPTARSAPAPRPTEGRSGIWEGVPALGSDPPPGQIVFDDLDEFPEDDPRARISKEIEAVLSEADEASRSLLNRILNEMGVEESAEPASHDKLREFLRNVAPEEEEAAARLAAVVEQKAAEEAELAAKREAAEKRAAEKQAEREKVAAEKQAAAEAPKIPPGYVGVFCPNGHQIAVKEERRGKTGRCRTCREKFFVPEKPWDGVDARHAEPTGGDGAPAESRPAGSDTDAEFYLEVDGPGDESGPSSLPPSRRTADDVPAEDRSSSDAESPGVAAAAGSTLSAKYDVWIDDVHWYQVAPAKVKQVPGALVGKHELADLGFAAGRLAVVRLVKKGLFGAADKKAALVREEFRAHVAKGGDFQDQPIAGFEILAADSLHQLGFEQPGADENSVFAGVPVFQEDWITLRFPESPTDPSARFVSLPLSRFREFARLVEAAGGPGGLGADLELPLKDTFEKGACLVTKQEIRWLVGSGWYLADPDLGTNIVGWKCASCGAVMSEAGREKASFGGKKAKSIATTSCLKCKKPFGRIPLVLLERKR